ncbi:MAG: hypothetical protein AAF218_02330 [Pseudomonadota bacterium]
MVNTNEDEPMTTIRQIKAIATRAEGHLLTDAAGVAALAVILIAGLYLPHFV